MSNNISIVNRKAITSINQYKVYLLECCLEAVLGIVAGFIVNQTVKNLIIAYPDIHLLVFLFLQIILTVTIMFIFEYYSHSFAESWNVTKPGILFVTMFFTVQRNYNVYFHKLFEYGRTPDTARRHLHDHQL